MPACKMRDLEIVIYDHSRHPVLSQPARDPASARRAPSFRAPQARRDEGTPFVRDDGYTGRRIVMVMGADKHAVRMLAVERLFFMAGAELRQRRCASDRFANPLLFGFGVQHHKNNSKENDENKNPAQKKGWPFRLCLFPFFLGRLWCHDAMWPKTPPLCQALITDERGGACFSGGFGE